jgi:hypothetical protein
MDCPSAMFVGLTRACTKLVIIHDHKHDLPSFVKLPLETIKILPYVKFRGALKLEPTNRNPPLQLFRNVCQLLAHLKSVSLHKLETLINKLFIIKSMPYVDIDIPSTINGKTPDTIENVSLLNGLAIPFMFEGDLKKDTTLSKYLKTVHLTNKLYIDRKRKINIYPNTIEEYLIATNLFYSISNNYTHNLNQINDYTWLTTESVKSCKKVLQQSMGTNILFEEIVEANAFYNSTEIYIVGRIDAYDCDTNTIYELKCVEELSIENNVQLCVYAWLIQNSMKRLWTRERRKKLKYILLNFRTGEAKEMVFDEDVLQSIIDVLLEDKFSGLTEEDDQAFISRFNSKDILNNDILDVEDIVEEEIPHKRLARIIKC